MPRLQFNNARELYLTTGEADRPYKAVAASANPQRKHIMGLLLLTGACVSELLQAEWRHVELERLAWLLPTSKTGKPRHVPFSQAAKRGLIKPGCSAWKAFHNVDAAQD